MDGDSSSIYLSAIIILLLLFFAAYFAVCETAFASVSRVRLKLRAARGDRRAKRAEYVTEHFDKAITTILIGTNIVHLAAAAYVTVLVTRRWGVNAVTLSTIITTVVVFFVGEMLPKSIAKKYSERFSLGTAGSLCFFMRIFTPVSFVLTAIGSAAARLTRGDSEVTVTEDELYDIIENMTDEGELDAEQGELVTSALSFGEVTVESILTARVDVTALDVDWPPEKIMDILQRLRHARVPVYEGTIDSIIGILQLRKYLRAWLDDREHISLRALLDEPYFVHQSMRIAELLPIMSDKKLNLAVVTDNYGGTLGIVTVEDILEELVGEIWDEHDEVVEDIVQLSENAWRVSGSASLDDLRQIVPIEDAYDSVTVNGWVLEVLGHLPQPGDAFDYGDLHVTVQKVARRRVEQIRIDRRQADEAKE